MKLLAASWPSLDIVFHFVARCLGCPDYILSKQNGALRSTFLILIERLRIGRSRRPVKLALFRQQHLRREASSIRHTVLVDLELVALLFLVTALALYAFKKIVQAFCKQGRVSGKAEIFGELKHGLHKHGVVHCILALTTRLPIQGRCSISQAFILSC